MLKSPMVVYPESGNHEYSTGQSAVASATGTPHEGASEAQHADNRRKSTLNGGPLRVRDCASRPVAASKTAIADRILKSFNTWSYKREQPSDVSLMQSCVEIAIAAKKPVPFVLYWGKGPRTHLAAPDLQCLDYIAAMQKRIHESYVQSASFTLLMTDTHAHLNDHPRTQVQAYFEAVEQAAAIRGFRCRSLSDVVHALPPGTHPVSPQPPPADVFDTLTASAGKWYGGLGSAAEGAALYFKANMLEKRAVEQQYPDTIFVTFNNSQHRVLFPDSMPIFYMYSMKKGVAVKPWFLTDAKVIAHDENQHHPASAASSYLNAPLNA
jgi:L-tyrosine isonitrile synthase